MVAGGSVVARVVEVVGQLHGVGFEDPHGLVVQEEPSVHVFGITNEGVASLVRVQVFGAHI